MSTPDDAAHGWGKQVERPGLAHHPRGAPAEGHPELLRPGPVQAPREPAGALREHRRGDRDRGKILFSSFFYINARFLLGDGARLQPLELYFMWSGRVLC